MLQNLIHGLTALGNGQLIAFLVVGSIAGMFVGLIPGLGGPVILSVVLAFVYHLSIGATLCLFLAVHAASYFSASTTSILLNAPAHPEAFAVTFDGFPMAQRGEAGRALGISAVSTMLGGIIGCAVFIGFIQVLDQLPGLFHPPEYVALVVLTLVLVGTLGSESASKAVISAGLGIMIASIGSSAVTGQSRYIFGSAALVAGIPLVAVALGSFAVPQMIFIFGTGTSVASQDMLGREVHSAAPVALDNRFGAQVRTGMRNAIERWRYILTAGLVGVTTGIVPGIGGFAANFMSYGIAQQVSRNRKNFGTGVPEGIVAAEGSSMAKEAGGLVPLLGLGIPGSVGGALFLAALTIKGVTVGYGFTSSYPVLPYEMAWIIALGGLIGTVAGLIAAPMLARITHIPGPLIVPFVMSLAVVGAFVTEVSFFVVMEVVVFTVVGFVLRRLRYSLAAFAVGLILGPTLEQNIHLTQTVYSGFTFLSRPGADVLFLLAIGVLVVKVRQLRQAARARLAAQTGWTDEERETASPYPFLNLLTTVAIAGIAGWFAWYGASRYFLATAVMPVAGATAAGAAAVFQLPHDIGVYYQYRVRRQQRRAQPQEAPARVPELVAAATAAGPVGAGPDSPAAVPASSAAPPAIVRGQWGRAGQYTRELVGFGWFFVCVAACWLFGFRVGVPLFAAAFGLLATGRVWRSWAARIVYSGLAAGVLWAATAGIFEILHLSFTPAL